MYLCVCRALNEEMVSEAYKAGAETTDQVFDYFETKVKCKLCLPYLEDHLEKCACSSDG